MGKYCNESLRTWTQSQYTWKMSDMVRYTVNRSTERQRWADPLSWVSSRPSPDLVWEVVSKNKCIATGGDTFSLHMCMHGCVHKYTCTEKRGVCNSTRKRGGRQINRTKLWKSHVCSCMSAVPASEGRAGVWKVWHLVYQGPVSKQHTRKAQETIRIWGDSHSFVSTHPKEAFLGLPLAHLGIRPL